MNRTWNLEGLGRLPWAEARDVLAGYTCAWLDLDGLHVGAPPAETPVATHLWGWADGRYVRARLDEDAAYVGVLREATSGDGPGEPVTVVVRSAVMRGSGHTGERAPDGLDGLAVELLEIPGSAPVTFVRACQRV